MSWLFSRALVAEYLPATCSDGEPSAPLSVMPTPHKFWRNDKTMEPCRLSRFGLTCAVLTADRGEALLMSYLEDSHARTLVLPDLERAWMGNAQDSGESLPASLAKYDHATHSLKTAQLSLIEDLTGCSVILPRWGSMRNGVVSQQPTLAPLTCANESGLWQTPVADDAVNRKHGKWNSRGEPKLSAQVLIAPTPAFPTPTVCGNYNRKGASKNSGDGLATYVRKFPTPTATAYKGWSNNHNRANTDDRLDYTVEREAHETGVPGQLNPTWEEWLMAWPIGWTELKPLEMDRFHEWQQQHSPHYQVAHTARMKAIDEELILTAEAVIGESDGYQAP